MRLGSGGVAIVEVNTELRRSKNVESFAQAYIVHSSTVDGLAQLLVHALAQERRHLPTSIPTRVAGIWVACSESEALRGGNIHAAAKCGLRGYREASADIVGTPIDSSSTLSYLEGLETTFISNFESTSDKRVQARNLCTRLVWKLDINMMSHKLVLLECTRDRPKEPIDAVQRFISLTVVIVSFVEEAINYMKQHPPFPLERHLEAYIGWMKYQQ